MDVGEADGRTDEVKNKCEDMTKKVTTRLEASRKRYKMNNQVVNSNHEFNTRFDNHNVPISEYYRGKIENYLRFFKKKFPVWQSWAILGSEWIAC